jgi:hypothetical protein
VANLRPTANLSGNALTPCSTTKKVKNSCEALYDNHLEGDNVSSDLRQTFVTNAANLPVKAHLVPNARFRFINVAEWETVEHFQTALHHPEFVTLRDATPFAHFPAIYEVVRT